MEFKQTAAYPRIKAWCDVYGKSDADDKRAVEDFMTCEANEAVASLRAELVAVTRGIFDDRTFDAIVGQKRRLKYGTYDAWAKIMLLWMANYKS